MDLADFLRAFASRLGVFFAFSGTCGVGGVFSIRNRTSSSLSRDFEGAGIVAKVLAYPFSRKPTTPRKIPKHFAGNVKSYSRTAGGILWAWNRIHAVFADCFAVLACPDNPERGLAIWHAVKADTAQRDMLTAALENTATDPKVAEALDWLLNLMGKLSQHRNDVAHTPMAHVIDLNKPIQLAPDFFSGDPARVNRLSRADLADFHRKFTGDLIALSYYAFCVAGELRSPRLYLAWPQRPALQCIPRSEVPLSRSQKRRLAESKARKLRQKSSPEKSQKHQKRRPV